MQTTLALAAIAAVVYAAPQGVAVTSDISPTGSAPAGFATTYPSSFQITAVNSTVLAAKRDIAKRAACPTAEGSLVITLTDGKLTDQNGRIGYIASNYQFQFDAPPQAGAIYTDGFSVGSNSSLALGSSAIFYQCLSGEFYNLYDRHWAAQCKPILIDVLPCGDSSSGEVTQATDGQPAATGVATAVSQITDGQPQAQSATAIVSQISDGQPQAPSAVPIPITQISDGQPQIPTAVISQISDGQPQAPTTIALPAPISQISDGQPQAPTVTSTAAPISQISDGQPQAPTSVAIISQISDGQPQAPTVTSTAAPISQISDGQPQAPTSVAIISQISDGQPQAPTTVAPVSTSAPAGAVITQISDGQPQVPANATSVTTPTTPAQITSNVGNSVAVGSSFVAIIVGLVAALL